jgi:cyclopropane fatty-acyl-phospholipid synthase-like methyltransferase
MTESATARYAMGYDDRERRRLQLQASIINPVTEQLLRRAGLGDGMRVLDVGSGVGDVAILAARIVEYDFLSCTRGSRPRHVPRIYRRPFARRRLSTNRA